MDLPHVSLRLMLVVSNVDNDDDVDGDDDDFTGNNKEVITQNKTHCLYLGRNRNAKNRRISTMPLIFKQF